MFQTEYFPVAVPAGEASPANLLGDRLLSAGDYCPADWLVLPRNGIYSLAPSSWHGHWLGSQAVLPAAEPLLPPPPKSPERDRVRILVYGSPRAIRHTIKQLHLLRFVEQFRWNPVRGIPENGIHVSRAEAEAYSFLLKELLLD